MAHEPAREGPGCQRDGRERSITIREFLGRDLNKVERKWAPSRLYICGAMEVPISMPLVAVVGTRNPSEEGVAAAKRIASALVSRGIAVVSGLARGIDTAAHEAAIDAGGRTVAVLGTPLDRFYPKENRALQLRIMRDHLAVSQFPAGHVTRPWDFPARNRTMALISGASIIVEAGERSGAVSQGWEALRLGRPLYIMEEVFRRTSWATEMEKYGARRLTDVEEGLDELSYELPPSYKELTELQGSIESILQ